MSFSLCICWKNVMRHVLWTVAWITVITSRWMCSSGLQVEKSVVLSKLQTLPTLNLKPLQWDYGTVVNNLHRNCPALCAHSDWHRQKKKPTYCLRQHSMLCYFSPVHKTKFHSVKILFQLICISFHKTLAFPEFLDCAQTLNGCRG